MASVVCYVFPLRNFATTAEAPFLQSRIPPRNPQIAITSQPQKMMGLQLQLQHRGGAKSASGVPTDHLLGTCTSGVESGITHTGFAVGLRFFELEGCAPMSRWAPWRHCSPALLPNVELRWMREKWAQMDEFGPIARKLPSQSSKPRTTRGKCWKHSPSWPSTQMGYLFGSFAYELQQVTFSVTVTHLFLRFSS